jgi:hypothetical protein
MKMRLMLVACAVTLLLPSRMLHAQEWSQPVRGSWIRASGDTSGVVLADNGRGCEIIVGDGENSAVKQAAVFLAADIEKISGYKPPIVSTSASRGAKIQLVTLPGSSTLPSAIALSTLRAQWEAYQILTTDDTIWLVGSDFRGTAYAAYTLSERIGIDPLYLWTGYSPEKHRTLAVKPINFLVGPPTFKYRGFFHDDEDILPRPFDENGYPLQTGTVPRTWYERFFETALRLRMNMVAPYVRVQRPYEIQKMASDWGLIYTSHHYDSLLSNPWGFTRFGLAAARNAGTDWDWFNNRRGMLNFWRGGVLENRDLNAYWPVGLRGTQDRAYTFPDGVSEEEKNRAYREAIEEQVKLTKDLLPADKAPLFHFTLYTEMLPQYLSGKLEVPPEVTIVWTDDNDGHMRALPQAKDQWKHGVYYHLAYFSTTTRLTKQVTHIVSPRRIEEEFRKIVQVGATEYMLVNVSELREYVMEARMLAELTWNAQQAFAQPAAADRYIDWWSREYFADAARDAATAYRGYYQLLSSWDQISVGANAVADALTSLDTRLKHKQTTPPAADVLASLERRDSAYQEMSKMIAAAGKNMTANQQQYFYENVAFPLLIDSRQTSAAIKLWKAFAAPTDDAVRKLCFSAYDDLRSLEDDIRKAERQPFENWYRKTWIRNDDSPYNLHRSYERTRSFLIENYLKP